MEHSQGEVLLGEVDHLQRMFPNIERNMIERVLVESGHSTICAVDQLLLQVFFFNLK